MKTLWNTNQPLTATALLMAVVLLFSLAGIVLDPRVITGVPAWLKPAKFAFSTGLYALTLAWMFTYLPGWPTLRATVGWITAVVMILEVGIIDFQAWRGTTSHFNTSTPLNQVLFSVMGIAILTAWFASIAVLIALFRTRIPEPGMAWAIRLGLLITILGTATGGMMVQPTKAQLAEARRTDQMPTVGAHTVGAPDGGPGMPGTGWSREHGDIRVAHFFGLHAMQLLPLFAWLFARQRPSFVFAASAAYFALFVFTLVQAMAGRPFLGGLQ